MINRRFRRLCLLPCPEDLKNGRLQASHEFTRLHLVMADMRVGRPGHDAQLMAAALFAERALAEAA